MTVQPLPQGRLYLALYIRDGYKPSLIESDDRYHWALLAIPSDTSNSTKTDQATRFHIRDYHSGPAETAWIYEEINVDASGTPKLLAQILIGDIIDTESLLELIRDLPFVRETEGWNCVGWLKSAVDAIELAKYGEVVSKNSGQHSWLQLRNLALSAADAEALRRAPKVETTESYVWEL